MFTTNPADRPLIVQFCANDPETLLKAAKLVENQCDAIDINLGCPQDIARRGHYCSYLQDEWDLIQRLVSICHTHLTIPVTCKIRIFPELEKTLAYAKMIQNAGASLLTVHGRTREMKGQYTGLADWQMIRRIKEALDIPVFANGNILVHSDLEACLLATGADGVMSAEGHLYNPALFTPQLKYIHELVDEYLSICETTPTPMSIIRGHLFKLYRPVISTYTDLREVLAKASSLASFKDVAVQFKERLVADERNGVRLSPVHSSSLSTTNAPIPHWFCQPYIRPAPPPKQPSKRKAEALCDEPIAPKATEVVAS